MVEEKLDLTNMESDFVPSSKNGQEMELIFNHVNVTINKRQILKDVSGIAKAGCLTAIMGPSGGGKTTLLNTLAGRFPCTSGEITLNGCSVSKSMRRKVCYVLQQDVFFPNLTLRETLSFTAMIRLPDNMPKVEKERRMEQLIDDLDLRKCLDTIIGDVWLRGLSGGEKKRANIACELITDPVMILLDEPTSGLDYSTAFGLIQGLKTYAKDHNKTVVTTIHQPSSFIFYQFDNLLLLSDGEVAYFGKTEEVIDFFRNTGFPMEPHYNPADFILEKLKEDDNTRQQIVKAAYKLRNTDSWPKELKTSSIVPGNMTDEQKKYQKVKQKSGSESYEADSVHISLMEIPESDQVETNSNDPKWPTGFITQYTQLTIRTFRQSKALIFNKFKIIETVVMTVLLSLIWFQLPRIEETLRDRMGVIFYLGMTFGFTPLFDTITSFPAERMVINKERSAGWYRLSAYYLAKMTSEIPLILVQPILFITVVYWCVGLNGVTAFFATIGTLIIHAIAGQSIGLFLGIVCMDIRKGMSLATVCIMGIMLLGGFYTRSLPPWLTWIKYISFLNYTFNCLLYLEFHNSAPFSCAAPSNNISGSHFTTCLQSNSTMIPSEDILKYYNIDWEYWQYLMPLFIYIVVFRIAGYLVLRFIQKPHLH
ncbi:uncharacterized protein LOC143083181 [Mytilus galloprovincialis]|uniref:uncharacterized protein LOC143083181 n=1 Tax=Mytilus galloprovincialis TaxID=29158 RepID=UPI003F7B38AD